MNAIEDGVQEYERTEESSKKQMAYLQVTIQKLKAMTKMMTVHGMVHM